MKRVVHVLNDLSTFFTHRKALIDDLKKDFEVIILAPEHQDHSALTAQGYAVRVYKISRKGLNPITELKTFLDLFQHYLELKPDVVHHFTIKPVIYGSIAARMAYIPRVVNSITGLGYVFTGKGLLPRLLRPIIQRLYRRAFKPDNVQVIFQNSDDRQLFIKRKLVRLTQAHVIPGSGVDVDKFYPKPEPQSPPAPFKVVLPARMLWDKGIGEFVDAARLILKQRKDVQFELVGGLDPNNRMAIKESTIRQWESEGLIHWRGRVDDMTAAYHESHVVCLPSYREGLPMALLEAAACGRPIVTTDAPGCRELVEHERTGLLVPPRESVPLAEAILRSLADADLREALGSGARTDVAETKSAQAVNAKVRSVYQ